MKPARRYYLLIAQILFSGALLAWLIHLVNPADLIAAARHVSLMALLATSCLLIVAIILVALRQWVILRMLGIDISLGRMTVLTWLGLFANNFLPSSVGGDAAIALALHRRYRRLDSIITGLLLNRVIGLIALLLVLLVLLILVDLGQLQPLIHRLTWWCLALLSAMALCGLAGLLFLRSDNRLSHLLAVLLVKLRGVGQTAVSISRGCAIALALSIIIMLLASIAPAMLGHWQYPPGSFWATATIFLLLQLVQLIPITFNGIGLAESVTAYCLTHVGWPLQEAVLFSLILRGLTIAVSLPGILAFLLPVEKGSSRTGSGN
jgi:uncharacterized membrane protein YbhN (UPF0104 family)